MNKLVKYLLVSTTIAFSGAVLIACGTSNTNQQTGSKIPLVFRIHNNNATMQRLIDKFNTKYPKYKATLSTASGYGKVEEENRKSFSTGNIANITTGYPDSFELYQQFGDYVVNLDKYIDDPEIGFTSAQKADFVPSYFKEGQSYLKSGTYSIALSKSTEITYYNKGFLDKYNLSIPTDRSWDSYASLAVQIKQHKMQELKDEGKTDQEITDYMKDFYPIGYDSDANLLIRSIIAKDPDGYTKFETDKDGKKVGKLVFSTLTEEKAPKVTIDAIKYFAKLNKQGLLNTKKGNGDKYLSDKFKEGRVIINIGSSGGARYALINDIKVGKTAIAQAPQFTGSNNKAVSISQGPSVGILRSKNEEQNRGAWLLIKELFDPEFQYEYNFDAGYSFIVNSAYQTPKYKRDITVPTTDQQKAIKAEVSQIYEKIDDKEYYISPIFQDSAKARKLAELLIHALYSSDEYKAIEEKDLASKDSEVDKIISKLIKDKYQEVFN